MIKNRLKEYGGYLPFETHLTNKNNLFFQSKVNKVAKLNCGRSSFYLAARSLKIKKIYIPYFTCIDTSQPFEDLGVPISFYRLDANLMPLDVDLKEDEYILWTNYYGNATEEMISFIENKYSGQIIADNCHAFFSPPLKNYSKLTPLGRMANKDEIIFPVIFLSSEASSYITGTTMIVDGGFTIK